MKRQNMKPDFLCIGAPKAGTSWLYRNIKFHPNVKMPPIKEIGYFNGRVPMLPLITSVFDPTTWVVRKATLHRLRKSRARNNKKLTRWCLRFLLLPRTDKWYVSLFLANEGQIAGDITPAYASMNADRVAHVHTLLPNAKVIYLLRNPIAQTWSYTAMHFRFWNRQGLLEAPEKKLEAYLDRQKRLKTASYLENLQAWTEFYPEQQIFVGFYDQLVEDPAVLFKDICRFLELDATDSAIPETVHQKRNVGRYPKIPDRFIHYLALQYYEQIEELHRRFSNQHTADWLSFAERCL